MVTPPHVLTLCRFDGVREFVEVWHKNKQNKLGLKGLLVITTNLLINLLLLRGKITR